MKILFLSLAALLASCATTFADPLAVKQLSGKNGAGLCCWSTLETMANFAGNDSLKGITEWMHKTHDGGGWPEKVDKTLAEFAKEKNRALVNVKHLKKIEDVLGHMATYHRKQFICVADKGGKKSMYGVEVANMITVIQFDGEFVTYIDTNWPDRRMLMSLESFRERFGGWAMVFEK